VRLSLAPAAYTQKTQALERSMLAASQTAADATDPRWPFCYRRSAGTAEKPLESISRRMCDNNGLVTSARVVKTFGDVLHLAGCDRTALAQSLGG
jgi:hypothetical protein